MTSTTSPCRSFLSASLALFAAALFAPEAKAAALEPLEIVTATGAHKFQVEVARTMKDREHGLMNRRSMPRDQGMLFDFHVEQPVSMWMKNTYIPLDMVFVAKDGHVTAVAQDAVPMSEAIISSGPPAYAVIEFNAGVARDISLVVGDLVRHPAFKP
jgi:hypothetical protein